MKLLFDFFPIVLFFIVYKTMGLYAAIYAMIGATFLQSMAGRYRTGKFENSHLITFGLLIVLGGVTLALRDPAFVMWKVSALYVVFSGVLIGSIFFGEKTILQRMMGKEMKLPKDVWNKLTWFWGIGFIGISIVNAFFVNSALAARKMLFDNTSIDQKVELSDINCQATALELICKEAQYAEESWVNFKLFGTMGLTIILIVITVIYISKYIKEEKE